ncbi:multicopper oxidase [Didymella exigua CBS 183.55]|uniref:Multicopper oxidase n=1 Tax=Didymella exigua CBS 183.55 TaxID=1150837 RepID=A0A6A5RVG6_9PLEO|nr:multicopper oxidase [Didymella exigua CBS 183.55]KAF1931350.1 multicopper oxidase [Didymella exigua CBS 183.55]
MLSVFTLCLSLAAVALAGHGHFKLELTWGPGSPDGYTRDMIFINGQYPGPLLELQQDDWIEIEVVNSMSFNSSIHFHGIHQTNTPWADGVPGLTQRQIQPGKSFKYNWHADQHGSYFYHAHSRGQIDDGAYGPIIIEPKAGLSKPFDKIAPAQVELLEEAEASAAPLLLSDWRHRTSEETWADQLASGLESAICMDSLLVNGKGAVDCWSREEITKFTSPGIAPVLTLGGLEMTDKGCFPPALFQILLGNNSVLNPSALPQSVFEVCTPTQGSREIIKVPHDRKWLALNVISSAGIDTFAFSIDEHPLWVFVVDGHYIEPVKIDVLTVANGDRYSVFVELTNPGEKNEFGIRIASLALAQLIDTMAVFSYSKGHDEYEISHGPYTNSTGLQLTSTPYTDRAGNPISANVTVLDHASTTPFPPQFPQPAPKPAQTFFLTTGNVGNSYTWALNATPFSPVILDNAAPVLYSLPILESGDNNITIVTQNNTWVDLVFLVPNLQQPPHPIHKHGNKAFILGAGTGPFPGRTVAEAATAQPESFNLVNPSYRDGFVTPPSADKPTWLAVRYKVENPGAWLLHCHIQSHLNGGMAVIILDGTNEWPYVPDEYKN